MSDRWSSLRRAWSWLHPQLLDPVKRSGQECWPDPSPAGSNRRRELLAEMQSLWTQDPDSTVTEPEQAFGLRLIARELSELDEAPRQVELLDHVSIGLLRPLRARQWEELQGALRSLPAYLDALHATGIRPLDPDDERQATLRVETLFHHIERRLLENGQEADRLLLKDLSQAVLEIPKADSVEKAAQASSFQQKELEDFEKSLERLEQDLEQRAHSLKQRYLGSEEGSSIEQLLELSANDHGHAEAWHWVLERHLQASHEESELRGLTSGKLEMPQAEPGLLPGAGAFRAASWMRPWTDQNWQLPDLSLLDPDAQSGLLREQSHSRLPLLAANQLYPGIAWRMHREAACSGPGSLLLRPEDCVAWADWSTDWLLRQGWYSGERRVRFMRLQDRQRILLAGQADLKRQLAVTPDKDLKLRFRQASRLCGVLVDEAWLELRLQPGRALRRALDLLALDKLERKLKRRWSGQAGSADLFHAMSRASLLEQAEREAALHGIQPTGEKLRELPPAKPTPRDDRNGLLNEVEQRLAELGRIRKEDFQAGEEFDLPTEMAPTRPPKIEASGAEETAVSQEPVEQVPESSRTEGSPTSVN